MTSATFRGSCLCGAVQYEITGEPRKFYHCHCRRCRKASGTGHATNLFIQPASLHWIRGEELIKAYKVPEAERFTNSFCGICGGRVPRQRPKTDIVIVPAGSLDDEPAIRPQARIFWDSRAGWSCTGEALPAFSGYPES